MTNDKFNVLVKRVEMVFAKRFIDRSAGTIAEFNELLREFKVSDDMGQEMRYALLKYNTLADYKPDDTDAMATVFALAIKGATEV